MGNPAVDIKAKKLLTELRSVNEKYCRNLTHDAAKDLLNAAQLAVANLTNATITKLQQSIGGHIGATKMRQPRKTNTTK